jgi:hypothetical protein
MERNARLRLSRRSLQTAAQIARNDFTLVLGGKHIVCDRFQAALLSPHVANALTNDPTTDEFVLENVDPICFPAIGKLIEGVGFVYEEDKFAEVISFCKVLGNPELSEQVMSFATNGEEITITNCLSRLRRKLIVNISTKPETDFIAAHFSDFRLDELRSMTISELESTLQSENLCIDSEDELLETIIQLGSDYGELIYHVRRELLRPESIDRFFNVVPYENVDDRIWSNIMCRLRHEIVYDKNEIQKIRFRLVVPFPEERLSIWR